MAGVWLGRSWAYDASDVAQARSGARTSASRDRPRARRDNAEGDAVNALFYAAEAAVDGFTEVHGIDTKKLHYLKASAATELHERGVLEADLAPLLRHLNQARKDIWYEGDDPDFARSLEDVFAEVEKLVEAGEGIS